MEAQCYICPYCHDDHYSGFLCAEILRLAQRGFDYESGRLKSISCLSCMGYCDDCNADRTYEPTPHIVT